MYSSSSRLVTRVSNSPTLNFFAQRSFAKLSDRAARKLKLKTQRKGLKNIPLLKTTLRKLYLKTHPDLFAQFPREQETNTSSYQELLGMLDSIQNAETAGFPPAKKVTLDFYFRPSSHATDFSKATLHLKTNGSNCRSVVAESLGAFFTSMELPPVFDWDATSWGSALTLESAMAQSLETERETARSREEERADATTPPPRATPTSKPTSTTQTATPSSAASPAVSAPVDVVTAIPLGIEDLLRVNDETFKFFALVPHFTPDQLATTDFVSQANDELEAMEVLGFPIKTAVHQIWNGERSQQVLVQGLSADAAHIVTRIVMHALAIDELGQEESTSGTA